MRLLYDTIQALCVFLHFSCPAVQCVVCAVAAVAAVRPRLFVIVVVCKNRFQCLRTLFQCPIHPLSLWYNTNMNRGMDVHVCVCVLQLKKNLPNARPLQDVCS